MQEQVMGLIAVEMALLTREIKQQLTIGLQQTLFKEVHNIVQQGLLQAIWALALIC